MTELLLHECFVTDLLQSWWLISNDCTVNVELLQQCDYICLTQQSSWVRRLHELTFLSEVFGKETDWSRPAWLVSSFKTHSLLTQTNNWAPSAPSPSEEEAKWSLKTFPHSSYRWSRWSVSSHALTLSCTRCTSQCSSSAETHPSAWWRSCQRRSSAPLQSARSCRCWRSSGRFLEAPGIPRRAEPWSLQGSYLMTSETGRRPRHLHLCAATPKEITSRPGLSSSASKYSNQTVELVHI